MLDRKGEREAKKDENEGRMFITDNDKKLHTQAEGKEDDKDRNE